VDPRQAFAGNPAIEVKSVSPGWVRLQLSPDSDSRERVTAFVQAELADLPGDLPEQLSLAVDELLGNAIEHGTPLNAASKVHFSLIRTTRMVLFRVGDSGPGFSWNALNHAAINNPPQDPLLHTEYRAQLGMRPGGFGILLVKQIADELLYSETGNEVVLIKYLDPL
jgi:anti-sigma regulatory factor (Ser/Thr protein kinase)